MQGTALNAGLAEAFALLQNPRTGPRVVGILGAAQIDRFGNLNSTAIGDYARPTTRFPGSGEVLRHSEKIPRWNWIKSVPKRSSG